MTDILSAIAARTAERVEERKARKPAADIIREAESLCLRAKDPESPFERAIKQAKDKEELAFLCEVKKASPSKGILAEDFPYAQIAAEYEEAGADAVSVLTEPDWFLGSDRHLEEIRKTVGIPILRKDFTVDSYQIYETKLLGADAVLLICALLDPVRLKEYIDIARGLGLSALVEAHSEDEVLAAAEAGAGVIGVNNRSLKTFEVDLSTSIRLRSLVPDNILFISESGIKTQGDIARLKACGADGVLIGETLMRSGDKKKLLSELKGQKEPVDEL